MEAPRATNEKKKRNNRRNKRKKPPSGGEAFPKSKNRKSTNPVKGGKGGAVHNSKAVAARIPVKSVEAPSLPSAGTSGGSKKNFITNVRFDSLNICEKSKLALKETMKYEFLTRVQHMTMPSILKGEDVLAQAKTGTGKTLGFLIPAVEMLQNAKISKGKFGILVMSSTRELAYQIGVEAKNLTSFQSDFRVTCFVGGTSIGTDKKRAQAGAHVLVATPGRLIDHLENTSQFVDRFSELRVLILDEADQLLEMGFQPSIKKIISFLPPKRTRQNLLFSATVPEALQKVAHIAMADGHTFINAIPKGDEHTHKSVPQYLVTCTLEEELPILMSLLRDHISRNATYKVIVFFTTARLCGALANIAQRADLGAVLEIHSRKSQSFRTKTSDRFRKGTNMILFSSDVSARGVDYPDVSLVLQVGLTEKAQYIHRLGRTARGSGGTEGVGILLLKDYEQRWMARDLKTLPMQNLPSTIEANVVRRISPELSKAIGSLDQTSKNQAYQAWLGFYNTHCKKFKWGKDELVDHARRFAIALDALDHRGNTPPILKRTAGKMNLRGHPGLNIVKAL